jgi:pantoate--beta-alanine ligase
VPFLSEKEMRLIHDISSLRSYLQTVRGDSSIGLVPTMGALHEGHLTLIRHARKQNSLVVVTIFVNPTQFGPNEDLDRYPRTLDADMAMCAEEGVDVVFAPSATEMYPETNYLSIRIEKIDTHLCGASRPGHFNGVLQIVNKLFQIVQPDHAYFGQKDIQQFVLIQTMVNEFNIPVELHPVPTVRESDGLAMSSRNRYLTKDQRKLAPELFRTITDVAQMIEKQLQSGPAENVNLNANSPPIKDTGYDLITYIDNHKKRLTAIGFKIDYLEVVNFKSLQPITSIHESDTIIVAIAAWMGSTRLIDNSIVQSKRHV